MRAPRVPQWWRDSWDPESEVLVLSLASTVLAGTGLALILMGALPESTTPPAPDPTVVSVAEVRQQPDRTPPKTAARPAKPKPRPKPLDRSVPVTLDIPSIGVHTPLMSLGLESDGTVEVPPLKGDAPAGWYKNLSTPGEAGPAVILGHVDSARDGPAVFYRLKELRTGARLSVARTDGSVAHFKVRAVARYPKDKFPTSAVYGPRPRAELRLVTCGGSFDALRRRYRDNVVVYAALTRTSRPN